jgi:hypothetical protein
MALNGNWLDPAPMKIGPDSGTANYAVASNGNGFAILTLAGRTLTIISRTGERHQVSLSFGPGEYLTYPSMAWDGSGYVAAWTGANNDIEGIRFDQDGQTITPRFNIVKTSRIEVTPSIACHEGSCVVAWSSNNSIAATRLINGVPVPFSNAVDNVLTINDITKYSASPKVLATHDGFLLLWTERVGPTPSTPSLLTASITQSGIGGRVPLGSIAITSAAMTGRDQLALTIARPANDPSDGGAMRAFVRVWPAIGRRRAAMQP